MLPTFHVVSKEKQRVLKHRIKYPLDLSLKEHPQQKLEAGTKRPLKQS